MVDFSYSIELRKSNWIFFWVAEQKIFFLGRFMKVSAEKAKLLITNVCVSHNSMTK